VAEDGIATQEAPNNTYVEPVSSPYPEITPIPVPESNHNPIPEDTGNALKRQVENVLNQTSNRRQMLIAGGAIAGTVVSGEIAKHHPIARGIHLLKDLFTQPDVHQVEPKSPSSDQLAAQQIWNEYQKHKAEYAGIVYRNIRPNKEDEFINLRNAPRVVSKGIDPDEYKTNYIGNISLKDAHFKPIEEALPYGNKTDDGNWATFFLPQWDREGKPIIENGQPKGQMVCFVIGKTEHTA